MDFSANNGTIRAKSITATNNASINIVLPNNADEFEITFTGTIQINGTNYTNNTIGTRAIQRTDNTTNYTINVNNGATIYDIKANTYTPVLLDETTMITISDSDRTGNISVNNNQYNILGGNSPGRLLIIDANEIPEDVRVTFYYSYARYSNNNSGNLRLFLGNQRVADHASPNNNNTNSAQYTVTDNTQSLYLTTSSGNNARGYVVSNMRLVYEKTVDGITYTYTQYLNGSSNTITITSTNAQHIGVQTITGNNQGNITKYLNTTNTGTITGNQDSYFRIYKYDLVDSISYFEDINGDINQTSVQNNFNNYYDDLDGYSKYLVDNAVKTSPSTTSVTVDKDSFVLIKARRSAGNSSSIRFNNITQNTTTTSTYYCFRVGAGTYNVTTTNSAVDEILILDVNDRLYVSTSGNTNKIVFEDNGVNRILFEEDYSNMALFNIDSIIPTPLTGLTKFETFVEVYPYIRNTSDSTALDLWEKDLVELVMTLFPTMKDNDGKYEIFNNTDLFDQESLKELVELLSIADYEDDQSALYKLIQYLGTEYYDETIITITDTSNELSVEVLEELKETAINEGYSQIKNYYIAAYLGNDFLKNQANNSLLNSKIYELLEEYQDGQYQFITSNTSIDSDKFIELMNHLGFDLNTQGYGIYALSSSKGILNGEFIPDNIVLDKLDAHYENDGDLYILSNEESSNWRGGLDDNEDNISNKDSVNYAILVEMKQLKKSIGTTIFTFDLIDESGITHYSSESSIDLDEGTITYYVPTGYFDNVSSDLNVIFDTISISNSAKLYLNDVLVSEDNTQITLNGLNADNIIRVVAQDTTVYKDYSIIFVEMDVDFEIQYSSETSNDNVATVPYKDGQVVIELTSTTLPKNLDLTPYIDIYKADSGEKMDRQTAFKLSNDDGDHIIDSNGDSIITMDILATLPYGEYLIEVNIFGEVRTLSLVKNPSTECDILEFEYDGVDITSALMQNGEYISYIDFGRAYNYDDLTDITSASFYLTRLLFSENATCQITVEKAEDEGLLSYTVTYEVIAENGNSKTFVHILKEKHPFKNYKDNEELNESFNFASHYKDGSITETLTYDYDNSNDINVEFERGSEPEYRVKYTLSNFYLLGEEVEFIIDDSNALGVSYIDSYAGITAVVTNACDAGVYTLVYSYKNVGTWADGEYERVWEFPAFIITKNYSKDATLNNITYIDGNSMLSSFSTVISVENSFRPSAESLNENEIDYHVYADLEDSEKEIFAAGTYINYVKDNVTDYSTSSYKDYYMIGVLSNANLSYYAPIFKIEDHAEIYQYTTREKLDYYGFLNQGDRTDRSILSNHDTCYIYVPYANSDGIITVFLIEVDDQNQWGNVYTIESNATGDPITTLENNKDSFEYDGVTYTIHESAGKPTNNSSLYMDYIGTPLEDHFWYVSYVVFSENALNTTNNEFVKYFHLSLIDLTNNVYFDVIVNTPLDFPLDSIYITFAGEGIETADDTIISKQLSANVIKASENSEYTTYVLDNDIQILPTGYYYFYLDLPDGYKVIYEITNGKTNKNEEGSGYDGAYLPPSSIVPQRISITFTIVEDENISGLWGVSTSEIYSRMAEEVTSE